jgi:hypothetical protein
MVEKIIERCVKQKMLSFDNLNQMWGYYYNHGMSNYDIAERIKEFNNKYLKDSGIKKKDYFDKMKYYFFDISIKNKKGK